MRVWQAVLTLSIFLFVAYNDYYASLEGEQQVFVLMWRCHKTHPVSLVKSKAWNRTLFSLPGVKTIPYQPNKPIEHVLGRTSDLIVVPYSEQAAAMHFDVDGWQEGEELCLYVDDAQFFCNLFAPPLMLSTTMHYLFWPVMVPWKAIYYLLQSSPLSSSAAASVA